MTPRHRSTRPHRVPRWSLIGLLLLGGGAALAASGVWRCGNAYQDSPCPQGQALQVTDARSAEQQRAAQQDAAAARTQAQDLRKERLARERAQRPAQAPAGIRVRQPEVTALPEDNPCQRQQALHGARRAVRCANGQPIYVAQPAR